MSEPSRVTCRRCGEPLLVWLEDHRYYVGCAYNGCALTALPTAAQDAITLASTARKCDAARGGDDGTR